MATTSIELIGRRVKIKKGKEKECRFPESLGITTLDKALQWIKDDRLKTNKIEITYNQIKSFIDNGTNMDITPTEKIEYKKAFIFELNLRAPTTTTLNAAEQVIEYYETFRDTFLEKYNSWKSSNS